MKTCYEESLAAVRGLSEMPVWLARHRARALERQRTPVRRPVRVERPAAPPPPPQPIAPAPWKPMPMGNEELLRLLDLTRPV